jgi:hypothetical protein
MTAKVLSIVAGVLLVSLSNVVGGEHDENRPATEPEREESASFKRLVKDWIELSDHTREQTVILIDSVQEFQRDARLRKETLQEIRALVGRLEDDMKRQEDIERNILVYLQHTLDRQDKRRELMRKLLELPETESAQQTPARDSGKAAADGGPTGAREK